MDQDGAALFQEALDPGGGRCGPGGPRQSQAQAGTGLLGLDGAVVEQEPHGPADDAAMDVLLVGEGPQGVLPGRLQLRVFEKRDRARDGDDAHLRGVRGIVVEALAGGDEAGGGPGHQTPHHGEHRLGVGGAHRAVAGELGQSRQRLHEVEHVGRDRGAVVERPGDLGGRLGQVGVEQGPDEADRSETRCAPRARPFTREAAASAIVPPSAEAATSSTTQSGCQARNHASLKVPRPRASRRVPRARRSAPAG